MNFLTTPSSKKIIVNLHIVTVEISELPFLLTLHFHAHMHQYTCIYTVQPWFFKHRIIWFLQFFPSFPWALGFFLQNTFNLPLIFQTSVFRIPHFPKPHLGPLRMNTLNISNFYIEFWKIRAQIYFYSFFC